MRTVLGAIQAGELVAERYNSRTVRVSPHEEAAWVERCRARALIPVVRTGGTGTSRRKPHKSEVQNGPAVA